MSSAVLVTGAAGFIGSHVAAAARQAGWHVTGVDCRPIRPESNHVTEAIRADAADPLVLKRIRSGAFGAVVHNAAITDTLEDRWDALEETNVRVPQRLALACAEAGVSFIYGSSGSVYGRLAQRVPVSEGAANDRSICSGPLNLYARSKLMLDEHMRGTSADVAWVGLRYTNVFGPGERHKGRMASILSQIVRNAASRQPVTLFADTLLAARDFIPVGVLARIVLRLVSEPVPSGVYNLGAGHAISFTTLLQWCAEFDAGATLDVRLVPNPIASQYQYWTCADVSALRAVLPGLEEVSTERIRAETAALYQRIRRRIEST